MSEHGKDHPDEFMGDGHDCLFVGESFLAFLEVVFPERFIVPCHHYGHEPDYPPKMSIPPLGYLALSCISAGLMDSRIKPCVSDELFVVIETAHTSTFTGKMGEPPRFFRRVKFFKRRKSQKPNQILTRGKGTGGSYGI